ncbi:MAG: P-II family nitrogen regulator [Actinobacteria bacterium]|nr:P-II family nitrogen regulator [Actinomycetota bacterium]MBU1944398.1 P-II family nitrogen regulator [Actinomycetota bacterium]MBU2688266.1 P-II family nitrogen regulator [Actinomycetota bacterium]
MKKIEAVIRPDKLDDVLSRLGDLSYPGVTISEVRGHGKQKGVKHMWRGTEYTVTYLPKIKIEVVVLDEDEGRVTDAIVVAARTGAIGDGKVFISDVKDAIRVRTGEAGDKAI